MAQEEAEDPVHLRDENMSKEDKYLVTKTLEALKTMASHQQLGGFEAELLQMLNAISRYNELAEEGKVDAVTAERMNGAMKKLWQNTLRFALDHGEQISELKIPLSNYNIAKTQSKFMEKSSKVVEKVTETVSRVKEVVQEVVSWVKKGWRWLVRMFKKVVRTVVHIVEHIPIVREVVKVVRENVINPVYEAAKNVIDSAKVGLSKALSIIGRSCKKVIKAVAEAVSNAFKKVGELASKAWNGLKQTAFCKSSLSG